MLSVLLLLVAACTTTSSSSTTTSAAPSTAATTVTTTPPDGTVPTVVETTTTTAPVTAEWGQWTLVLASIPIGAGAEADATERALEVPGAGVLLSNDYPSLNPDYWVVFFGAWPNRPGTEDCPSLPTGFTCYPRYLGDEQVETAIALVEQDLVEINTATGNVVRTIAASFSGDGAYRGGFELTPDRQYLYFSEGWEDSWYSPRRWPIIPEWKPPRVTCWQIR